MNIYILNQMMVKIEFSPSCFLLSFFISEASSALSQCIALFSRKSAPFCSAQVHDITVFNERHFDRCLFYQWYMPTASMKDTIFNLVWSNVCMPSR